MLDSTLPLLNNLHAFSTPKHGDRIYESFYIYVEEFYTHSNSTVQYMNNHHEKSPILFGIVGGCAVPVGRERSCG